MVDAFLCGVADFLASQLASLWESLAVSICQTQYSKQLSVVERALLNGTNFLISALCTDISGLLGDPNNGIGKKQLCAAKD